MRGSICVAFVGLIACGGDEETVMLPLDAEERATVCGDYCAHAASCGVDEATCTSWCDGLASLIRADAARALLACWSDVACAEPSESGCLGDVIDATDPTAAYDAANAACRDAAARCGASYACDATYFVILSDPTLDAVRVCFDAECGAIAGCVVEAFGG
jgi:hypothetical protein